MKAVILVGGEGTRLRPLTYSIVKSMVPVVNRPFIEHVIRKLASHDIKEIVLAMGYKPDSIFDYFRKGHMEDIKLTYSMEEQPLGTAGAVKNAWQHIDQTFFVLNGDVFSDIDLTDMLRFHRQCKADATIALTCVEDPTKFGVVETDEEGRVRRFIEKPPPEQVTSHWINAGVYILEPGVLDYIPGDQFYMFERGVFPEMLHKDAPVFAYRSEAYWIDMGTPSKYQQINFDLLLGQCSSPLYNPGLPSGSSSKIKQSARISEPVVIGESCTIDDDVSLEGPVVIGHGCHLKKAASVSNSILWDGVVVGEKASITNSIIAGGAKIKGNTHLEGQTFNHRSKDRSGGK